MNEPVCAAWDCPDAPMSTVQSSVREDPLPVCDKGVPGAKGFGVHGPCFMVRPEYVEKKP